MMHLMPKLLPVGGYPAKTLLSVQRFAAASATASHTQSGVAIGAANAARRVYLMYPLRSGTSRTINSVTIGGVAATRVVGTGTTDVANIYTAIVPTGTTASIVTTYSGTTGAFVGYVFSMLGVSKSTPISTDSKSYASAGVQSISAPKNTILIGEVKRRNTNFSTNPASMEAVLDTPTYDPEFGTQYPNITGAMGVNMTVTPLTITVGSRLVASASMSVSYNFYVIG